MAIQSLDQHILRLLATLFCLLLAGCPKPGADDNASSTRGPLAGVTLRLLVVGDPAIAAGAGQLRGEWEAQTGCDFTLEQLGQQELADADALDADAVICPSHLLGVLAERELVAPLPKKHMRYDGGPWAETFELPKLREAAWAERVRAVSFGSPVMVCYYRPDLLEKLRRRPPRTWAEYQKLAKLLADRKALGEVAPGTDATAKAARWSGTIEPLGPGWAGIVLLARAAPYAKHRDQYSTLFDTTTMEPLVAGEPFVRALRELVAAVKLGPSKQLEYDPAAVRAAFWRGECGMALSWPTAAADVPAAEGIEVGFVELPGSKEVFNVGTSTWESRADDDDPRVVLLGIAGRLGVVSAKSAHPEAAWQLLFWLSGEPFSPDVCAASPAVTLFRRSHTQKPRAWVEKPVSTSAAAEYAAVVEAAARREQWLFALRIPGRSQYLSALDAAVHAAVRGEQSPAEALRQAAGRWRAITQRLGTEKQKSAYLHSLGL